MTYCWTSLLSELIENPSAFEELDGQIGGILRSLRWVQAFEYNKPQNESVDMIRSLLPGISEDNMKNVVTWARRLDVSSETIARHCIIPLCDDLSVFALDFQAVSEYFLKEQENYFQCLLFALSSDPQLGTTSLVEDLLKYLLETSQNVPVDDIELQSIMLRELYCLQAILQISDYLNCDMDKNSSFVNLLVEFHQNRCQTLCELGSVSKKVDQLSQCHALYITTCCVSLLRLFKYSDSFFADDGSYLKNLTFETVSDLLHSVNSFTNEDCISIGGLYIFQGILCFFFNTLNSEDVSFPPQFPIQTAFDCLEQSIDAFEAYGIASNVESVSVNIVDMMNAFTLCFPISDQNLTTIASCISKAVKLSSVGAIKLVKDALHSLHRVPVFSFALERFQNNLNEDAQVDSSLLFLLDSMICSETLQMVEFFFDRYEILISIFDSLNHIFSVEMPLESQFLFAQRALTLLLSLIRHEKKHVTLIVVPTLMDSVSFLKRCQYTVNVSKPETMSFLEHSFLLFRYVSVYYHDTPLVMYSALKDFMAQAKSLERKIQTSFGLSALLEFHSIHWPELFGEYPIVLQWKQENMIRFLVDNSIHSVSQDETIAAFWFQAINPIALEFSHILLKNDDFLDVVFTFIRKNDAITPRAFDLLNSLLKSKSSDKVHEFIVSKRYTSILVTQLVQNQSQTLLQTVALLLSAARTKSVNLLSNSDIEHLSSIAREMILNNVYNTFLCEFLLYHTQKDSSFHFFGSKVTRQLVELLPSVFMSNPSLAYAITSVFFRFFTSAQSSGVAAYLRSQPEFYNCIIDIYRHQNLIPSTLNPKLNGNYDLQTKSRELCGRILFLCNNAAVPEGFHETLALACTSSTELHHIFVDGNFVQCETYALKSFAQLMYLKSSILNAIGRNHMHSAFVQTELAGFIKSIGSIMTFFINNPKTQSVRWKVFESALDAVLSTFSVLLQYSKEKKGYTEPLLTILEFIYSRKLKLGAKLDIISLLSQVHMNSYNAQRLFSISFPAFMKDPDDLVILNSLTHSIRMIDNLQSIPLSNLINNTVEIFPSSKSLQKLSLLSLYCAIATERDAIEQLQASGIILQMSRLSDDELGSHEMFVRVLALVSAISTVPVQFASEQILYFLVRFKPILLDLFFLQNKISFESMEKVLSIGKFFNTLHFSQIKYFDGWSGILEEIHEMLRDHSVLLMSLLCDPASLIEMCDISSEVAVDALVKAIAPLGEIFDAAPLQPFYALWSKCGSTDASEKERNRIEYVKDIEVLLIRCLNETMEVLKSLTAVNDTQTLPIVLFNAKYGNASLAQLQQCCEVFQQMLLAGDDEVLVIVKSLFESTIHVLVEHGLHFCRVSPSAELKFLAAMFASVERSVLQTVSARSMEFFSPSFGLLQERLRMLLSTLEKYSTRSQESAFLLEWDRPRHIQFES